MIDGIQSLDIHTLSKDAIISATVGELVGAICSGSSSVPYDGNGSWMFKRESLVLVFKQNS